MEAQNISQMVTENRQAIVEAAEALYDSRLPYHNFDHVRELLVVSENLLQKCKQEQIDVDADVVFYALLFHDAGFQDDNLEKGFATKESYSAHLAETVLQQYGFQQTFIEQVKQAINSTYQDGVCVSNEDKVVKSSDLHGLSADYQEFKKNSIQLMKEYNQLHNKNISWEQWTHMASVRLEKYLTETIFLTSDYFDQDGNCLFIESARSNIEKMLADKNL